LLFDALFAHAAAQPESVAIVDDAGHHTYRQLAQMAATLAARIGAHTNRQRLGLLLPSGAAFVSSFYAALLAGKAVVPLNFLLGDREVAHCIADSGIDAIVTIPQFAARLDGARLKIIEPAQFPPHDTRAAPLPQREPAPSTDLAVLMYTSGTSGLPKGVPLTYGNLQSNVDASIKHMDFQQRHKFLGIVPLFHAFGLTATMLAPIQLGATVVYLSRFSPVGTLSAIKDHGISIMGGVPSMFGAMLRLKEASADDFKTIYAMISGGEPLPAAVREGFRTRFGVTLYEAYGMTETSLAITVNTPQMHKAGSVGKAIPGMQIRITDDTGNALPAGQEGEIQVKGPMVMKGYHNLPSETSAAMTADGYFKTGDLGKVDSDGFLYITGRKKDLIIVAGEKVAPREIEETLMAHPAVAEAAVVGIASATRGETIAAFVTARHGQSPAADDIRKFCRERGLPSWKVPRHIYVVPDLPRSPTGKVLKRQLRPPTAPSASESTSRE
jgi:long-chain acyl-CoA synthetase